MDNFFGPDSRIFDAAGGSSGPSSFDWVVFALLCAVLLTSLVSLILDAYYRSQRDSTPSGTLAVLDDRYARGEIDRAAYLQARADLGGPAVPSEATTEVVPAPKPTRRRSSTPPATA